MRSAVIMITIVTTVIIIIMRSAGRSDDSGPPSQSGSNDPRLSGPYYLHYCLDSITWPELPLIAIFMQIVSIRSSYILRHIGLLEAKRGKYSTRALWQYRFLSLGRLHVPREVDLADKTRDRSDLSMSARSASLGTYSLPKDIKNFELSARVLYFKHRSRPRARPVWQRFCSCPPPAGQYELYTPLIVYRISRMLYCSWAISKHLNHLKLKNLLWF